MKRVLFALVFIVPPFLIACGGPQAEEAPQESPAPMSIQVTQVQQRDMADTLHLFGRVAFVQKTRLASQFAGRLDRFQLLPGDAVQKGQIVGIIVPPQKEALSRLNHDASDPQINELINQHVKTIPLTAPVTGSVIALYHHSGDVVQAGEAIADIGLPGRLQVLVPVPVHYLDQIRRDLPAEVVTETDPPQRFSLPIEAVTRQVNAMQQAVTVRLELPQRSRYVLAGSVCQVNFLLKQHPQAVVVPRQAILEWEGEHYVFLVEDGKVTRTRVRTGIWQNRWVEIQSGLKPGQTIAVSKVYSLEDGMEVRVQ